MSKNQLKLHFDEVPPTKTKNIYKMTEVLLLQKDFSHASLVTHKSDVWCLMSLWPSEKKALP